MATEHTAMSTGLKEVKVKPPQPFTGKRTELKNFMQDVVVYLAINKEIYNTDNKKVAFALSFMTEGDAKAWKEEFLTRKIKEAITANKDISDLSLGSWIDFDHAIAESFRPFDAPGDALSEMRNLKMGHDASIDEHVAKFKILVSQTELGDSAAFADFFRETLPTGLQRQILTSDTPPITLKEWYEKAARLHNNWKRMQKILGRGNRNQNTTTTNTNNYQNSNNRKFYFPKKERDPNAMDVDRLSIEERNTLMKEGRCLKCRQPGHLSRDCKMGYQPQPKQETKKKWDGNGAAAHIRALIAEMDEEEKQKLEENLETEGLGF